MDDSAHYVQLRRETGVATFRANCGPSTRAEVYTRDLEFWILFWGLHARTDTTKSWRGISTTPTHAPRVHSLRSRISLGNRTAAGSREHTRQRRRWIAPPASFAVGPPADVESDYVSVG